MTANASRRSGPRDTADLAVAEIGMLLVHLAVVIGFGRLYDDSTYLFDLVAYTLLAHGLAVITRRARVPVPVAAAIGVGGFLVATGWILFGDTTTLGLPTGATLDAARVAVDRAGDEFRTVAAPTAVLPGFQLFSGLALWGAVWFADWAAFRLRATAEALAPALILFVFCSVLGAGGGRFAAAVVFAATVVFFVANHRAMVAALDDTWVATSAAEGSRSVRRAALGAGAVVVLAGAVVAPLAPGYGDDALVRWRNKRSEQGLRTTVSPIVDLRRRLVSQSYRELFEVKASEPAYWRLTSLHEFDGQLWSSGGDFGVAEEQLPASGPVVGTTDAITQEIRIRSLSALWVPAAHQAAVLHSTDRPLRWNADSATLIVDSSSDDSDDLRYSVTSQRPVLDPVTLASAGGPDPEDIADRYLALPTDFPSRGRLEAREAVEQAEGRSRYDQALALQNHFRAFAYSTDIPPGHGNDALVDFLDRRSGYCEQFAGAYAAMARSLGIPARVAVGFTPGDEDPARPGTYVVKGLHAHAWPEVYFPNLGWVPFEPTPGRGMPGAESYTGIPPQQDNADDLIATSTTTTLGTTTTSTTPGAAPSTTTPSTPDEAPVRGSSVESSQPQERSTLATAAIWLAALLATGLAVLLAAPRLRAAFRNRDHGGRDRVLAAWADALPAVRWSTGLSPRPSETHPEFAARAAGPLEHLAEPVAELAGLASRAAWDPVSPDDDTAHRAAALAQRIDSEVRAEQTLVQRLRRRLSWREAFGMANGHRTSPTTPLGAGREQVHSSASVALSSAEKPR